MTIKQKCIDYIEKWPFMVIFLYNPYIFFWLQNGCLQHGSQQEVVVYLLLYSKSVTYGLWMCLFVLFFYVSLSLILSPELLMGPQNKTMAFSCRPEVSIQYSI